MAPPQVNLNEKPPAESFLDPLPEKEKKEEAPVVVTVERARRVAHTLSAEQRRQRKRCRVACCVSMSVLLVLLMALGTACLVYRSRHRKVHQSWKAWCGTSEAERIPEHVEVDHDKQLIYVRHDPQTPHPEKALDILHEYNRRLLAFVNATAKTCYIDRLDETFEAGYARWQGYEEVDHFQNRTLLVNEEPIDIKVVKYFAGTHIVEHCGGELVQYYWAMEITETEVRKPESKYIQV